MKFWVSCHYTDEIEADNLDEAIEIAEDNCLFWMSIEQIKEEKENG